MIDTAERLGCFVWPLRRARLLPLSLPKRQASRSFLLNLSWLDVFRFDINSARCPSRGDMPTPAILSELAEMALHLDEANRYLLPARKCDGHLRFRSLGAS